METLQSYTGGCIDLDCFDDSLDIDLLRQKQGFTDKVEFLTPYYYKNDTPSFVEVFSYRKPTGECIVCLWDYNRELFKFYCHNQQEELQCVKDLIEIAKNITYIQKSLKELEESEQ